MVERPIKLDQHLAEMRIISSDASSDQVKLGFKQAIVIDLSKDIKDILVSDPGTVNVIPETRGNCAVKEGGPPIRSRSLSNQISKPNCASHSSTSYIQRASELAGR
jgi:hypothetical protein